jgi:hypothetical protein
MPAAWAQLVLLLDGSAVIARLSRRAWEIAALSAGNTDMTSAVLLS